MFVEDIRPRRCRHIHVEELSHIGLGRFFYAMLAHIRGVNGDWPSLFQHVSWRDIEWASYLARFCIAE